MNPNAQAKIHWADQMALEIEERLGQDTSLRQLVQEKGLLVYDEKTPSGIIHIGSGRGWIIHDALAKALRARDLPANFVLSSDDYDPYDKSNKDLDPAQWDRYLGRPFCDIPSPVAGFTSFGDYFFKESTQHFQKLGIECELESTAENYRRGLFNAQIKTVLDNADGIVEIFRDMYGDTAVGAGKLPFNVKCPQCGRISTTISREWDRGRELIHYNCEDGVVAYVGGCGSSGWISPYNGGGKFPWKVEWACKWPARGVIVEFAGKDHFSKGGARTCSNRIAVDILKFPPPYPSNGYATGKGYEFFQVGGAKMSTSKGTGMSFSQAAEFFPPELLRFLLLKSKPQSVIDFDPTRNDIILLCDHFDKMERMHFGIDEVDEAERALQSRLHSLVWPDNAPDHFVKQIPLTMAAMALQTSLSIPVAMKQLHNMGHLPEDLDEASRRKVEARLALAGRWIEHYADEQFRFQLIDENNAQPALSAPQARIVEALARHVAQMPESATDSKVLHNSFYDVAKSLEVDTKELFKAAYLALIAKDRGPQLANFILTVGYRRCARLMRASLNAGLLPEQTF